ncbi:cation/H(+) antiporter 15-like [Typha latifolia]|uniref:cation/H(+) antiporter 15-like n=1 Tax=Typha latifolia TaxID=4733 RepID=UPI003C2ADB84
MVSAEFTPEDLYHNRSADLNQSIFCYRASMTSSAGIWLGDNPLNFSMPLLLYQIIIIFVASRLVHAVLRRLDQPIVISQIMAGLLLGPSFLGRSKRFEELFFAPQCWEQLNTIAFLSFILFLFTVGVKTDLGMIPKSGKKAAAIAFLGTFLPVASILGTAYFLRSHIPPRFRERLLLANLASRWSMTSYTVLSCALSELNLLTSKLGRLAMSASLIADFANTFVNAGVTGYILLYQAYKPHLAVASIIAFSCFVMFLVLVARPLAIWLIRRTPEGGLLEEASLISILLLALGCGLISEVLGYHATMGPFFLGLLLPGGEPLGVTVVERLDRLVAGVFLPVFVTLAGLRMDIASLKELGQWGFMELFMVLAVIAKFVGTAGPCLYCQMPLRDAISFGLMMNFKGIFEVNYASQWQDDKILDNQLFTILLLTVLILGGGTAALVKHLYRPEDRFVAYRRRTIQHSKHSDELRVLACIHSSFDVNPVLSLLDASNPSRDSPMCVYLLHLIQLAGRANAVLAPHMRGPTKISSSASESDRIVNAFRYFEQQRSAGISVLPYVCISPYATMHDDICSVAMDKKVTLVLVPFHKQLTIDGTTEASNPAIQTVNTNVLSYAPCSVGILVDRGLSGGVVNAGSLSHHVAVYFLGGADDREALAYAMRMAVDPMVRLTVIRFRQPNEWKCQEDVAEGQLDDEVVDELVRTMADGTRVVYREEVARDGEGMVGIIRETSLRFSLLMVGRRQGKESPLTEALSMWSEHPELGIIGDLLASTDFGCMVPTLVVQQQTRVGGGRRGERHLGVNPIPELED